MRRLSQATKIGLLIEVTICFGPIALLLLLGCIFLLPSLFLLPRDPLNGAYELVPLVWIAGGFFGLASLAIVVGALCSDLQAIRRPDIALTGMVAGSAAIVHAMGLDGGFDPMMIVGLMPVLASAHIAYLARGLLFRPGVAARTSAWVATSLIILTTVFATFSAVTGQSQTELAERKAAWIAQRPAEYAYSLSVTGVQDSGLTTPRLVRVRGERVAAARYLSAPMPGRPSTDSEPAELKAWTIDRLFDELVRAESDGARVRARFDERFGHPTHMRVEYADASGSTWFAEMKSFETID